MPAENERSVKYPRPFNETRGPREQSWRLAKVFDRLPRNLLMEITSTFEKLIEDMMNPANNFQAMRVEAAALMMSMLHRFKASSLAKAIDQAVANGTLLKRWNQETPIYIFEDGAARPPATEDEEREALRMIAVLPTAAREQLSTGGDGIRDYFFAAIVKMFNEGLTNRTLAMLTCELAKATAIEKGVNDEKVRAEAV